MVCGQHTCSRWCHSWGRITGVIIILSSKQLNHQLEGPALKVKRINGVTVQLFRASLEAERNSFMLYLRGEVFIRAALVKVRPWNLMLNFDWNLMLTFTWTFGHCEYQGERNGDRLSYSRSGDHWSSWLQRGIYEGEKKSYSWDCMAPFASQR